MGQCVMEQSDDRIEVYPSFAFISQYEVGGSRPSRKQVHLTGSRLYRDRPYTSTGLRSHL
jgi:hypothetical protein